MTAPANPLVFDLMLDLATCLCDRIIAAGLPEPCFCGVLPGNDVAFDSCEPCTGGRCGQAWVRMTQMFPSSAFPAATVNGRCDTPLAFEFELGVVRCAPVADSRGNPPTMEQYLDVTKLQMQDAMAMRQAVQCCAGLLHREYLLETYTPIGPLGGCVGGSWLVAFSEV